VRQDWKKERSGSLGGRGKRRESKKRTQQTYQSLEPMGGTKLLKNREDTGEGLYRKINGACAVRQKKGTEKVMSSEKGQGSGGGGKDKT